MSADKPKIEAADPSLEDPEHSAEAAPFPRKMTILGLTLAAMLALPYAHPSLSRLRLFDPKTAPAAEVVPIAPIATVGEVAVPGVTDDSEARAAALAGQPVDARSPIAKVAAEIEDPNKAVAEAPGDKPRAGRNIEDPSGHALDAFFAALERSEKKEPGAITRIVYFGDSIVASDLVTGKYRRMLQTRFGDAGHGYAMIANAWPGWFHIDVSRKASDQWKVSRILGPYAPDGFYGLGGASFHAVMSRAWAKIGTADVEQWGRAVSRFEVEYLAQPGGGDVSLKVDGQEAGVLKTAGDTAQFANYKLPPFPDGPHQLEINTVDTRPVRLFGFRMERDVPGVTLTACGITGGRIRFLSKSDKAHWAAALKSAKPDLVVFSFGSNESADGLMYPLADYERTMLEVMHDVREALPKASLMLVGPPDMASATDPSHSRTVVPLIVGVQRKVAAAEGWAFWDQFAAMGGTGSMWRWIASGLGNPDMFHPSGIGGNQLGTWQFNAMMKAYEGRKK